jgi:Cu/Ag efflux protein CusF
MHRSLPLAALAAAVLLNASPARAQMAGHQHAAAPASAAATAEYADGEVRKVDKGAKKLTLRHGPIPNLGMGGMTMVFGLKDPSALDKLKVGDKVRFKAEQVGGDLIVTEIVQAK